MLPACAVDEAEVLDELVWLLAIESTCLPGTKGTAGLMLAGGPLELCNTWLNCEDGDLLGEGCVTGVFNGTLVFNLIFVMRRPF